MIYNVSCHNLAELCAATGKKEDAEAFYKQAYNRLVEAAQSPATPLGLRVSCVQHLKHALGALVQNLKVGNANGHVVDDVIERAHNTAYSVFRTAQHARQADTDCPHCPIVTS